MPRSVDTAQHRLRRDAIVEAAAHEFARLGFARATTAGVCREAGVSSGTFFHYFPTKLNVLVAVLEHGNDELRSALASIECEASGLDAVVRYAELVEAEIAEPGFPTFVSGLAGVEAEPPVAAALAAEAQLTSAFLARHVASGRERDGVRTDVPATELATWISWLVDGAAQRAATSADDGPRVADAVRALARPAR